MLKKELKKIMNNKGFSLVEALIAIAILMISVTAPLVLANNSITAAVLSQQQIIAFYLAQDGMEWVINKKTGNRLVLGDILNGLNDCRTDIGGGHGCYIDTLNGNIESCNVGCPNGFLKFHPSSGVYDYTSGAGSETSHFKRYIKITPKKTDPVTSEVVDASLEVSVE